MPANVGRSVVALLCGVLPAAAVAQQQADLLVQPPALERPERASLAGAFGSYALEPEELSRGSLSMPSAIDLPQERGAPLMPFLPTYAPDHGLTEWGLGWSTNLVIQRTQLVGEVDYATDVFTTPWGRVERAAEDAGPGTQAWRPAGLRTAVVLKLTGNEWVAETSNATFTFRSTDAVPGKRGLLTWWLSEVRDVRGDATRFTYLRNDTGRVMLDRVTWAEREGEPQYRLQLEYERLPRPISDFRRGVRENLDARVSGLAISVRTGGAWLLRSHHVLEHARHGEGQGFVLRRVVRELAAATEPPKAFEHQLSTDVLDRARWQPVTGLERYVSDPAIGDRGIQPTDSTPFDADEDGVPDLENHVAGTLLRHTPGGWSVEQLPPPTGAESPRCRPAPAATNAPRTLLRMWESPEPHVLDTLFDVARGTSSVLVCHRDGRPISEALVDGDWRLTAHARIADLDGDRQPDLVRVFPGGYEVRRNTSTPGQLRFAPVSAGQLSPHLTLRGFWVHDMNGDGVADLVGHTTASMVIWYGTTERTFTSSAVTVPLIALSGTPLTQLQDWSFTFVDVDHDGAADLLLSRRAQLSLFINAGAGFREQRVPALLDVPFDTGYPVPVDLDGSGEPEIAVAWRGKVYALRLSAPGVGLMRSASDGKGTDLTFEYARSAPTPLLGRRVPLLARHQVMRNGRLQAFAVMDYERPHLHSVGRQLLGFELVRRTAPRVVTDARFRLDDSGATLVERLEVTDSSPLTRFTRLEHEPYALGGVQGLRQKSSTRGWRQGAAEVAETQQVLRFERGACPVTTRLTHALGTLTTTETLSAPEQLRAQLHCLVATRTVEGRHADASKNFRYTREVERNSAGSTTAVYFRAPTGRTLLQRVQYDDFQQPIELSSPDKGTLTVRYDEAGLLSTIARPDGTRDHVVSRLAETDDITAFETSRGGSPFVTQYRFDALERLEKTWSNFDSSERAPRERYAYVDGTSTTFAVSSRAAMLSATAARVDAELSDASGAVVARARDTGQGWALEAISEADALTGTTSLLQPSAGVTDLLAMRSPSRLFAQRPALKTSTTDPLGAATTDSEVLATGVRRDLAARATLRDGRLEHEQVEGGGELRRSARDVAGRLLWVTDESGASTRFDYDVMGRLLAITLGDGSVHRRAFDDRGRVKRVSHGPFGSVEYAYDPATGRLVEKSFRTATGAVERRVRYGFDELGRPTGQEHVRSGSPTVSLQFDLGAADAGTAHGQVQRVTGPGWAKSWQYNLDGTIRTETLDLTGWRKLVVTHERHVDGSEHVRRWELFDEAGRPVDSVSERFEPDSAGRLRQYQVDGAPLFEVHYDSEGRDEQLRFAGGATRRLSYDPLTHRLTGWAQGSQRVSWGFSRRATLDFEELGTRHRSYQHDARGFLAHSSDDTRRFEYDPVGLIRGSQPRPGRTVAGLTYDALGRVIAKGPLRLTYGATGRVDSATDGSDVWTYSYDELGVRILSRRNGAPATAVFNHATFDATGLKVPVVTQGRVLGVLAAGRFEPLAVDARNTPIEAGVPTPYGHPSAPRRHEEVVAFAGEGLQPELGTVRTGARDYDPSVGMFWSPDPLVFEDLELCVDEPDLCNLFSYGHNDPLVFRDGSGAAPKSALELLGFPPPGEPKSYWTTLPAGPPPPQNPLPLTAKEKWRAEGRALNESMRQLTKGLPFFGISVTIEDCMSGKISGTQAWLEAGWNLFWAIGPMWASAGARGIAGTAGGPRAGMEFTPGQKLHLKLENQLMNDGVMRCPFCDVELAPARQSVKGVTPPRNEVRIDHARARSRGGDGALSNGQCCCSSCNLLKSDGELPYSPRAPTQGPAAAPALEDEAQPGN